MGAVWLNGTTPGYPSLEAVCRPLAPQMWSGWASRSRSSGGFTALLGIVVHHTASPAGTPFSSDAAYCATGHPDSPVASMVLGRAGELSIHAGGAANHAGQGGPWQCSAGTVPLDSGNSHLLGIEAANNGTGEAWSVAQVERYLLLVGLLCDAYGLDPLRDVIAHAEWAPTRKIDPWGGSSPTPGFAFTGPHVWHMDAFRAAVGGAPTDEEDTLLYVIVPKGSWAAADTAWLIRYSSGRLAYASSADVAWATEHNIPQKPCESPSQYNILLATSDVNGITPPVRV